MPDIGVTEPLFGFYRAKVVLNKDPEKKGRVLLWIPDIMPLVSDSTGLWARPGNNPLGGEIWRRSVTNIIKEVHTFQKLEHGPLYFLKLVILIDLIILVH